MTKNKGIISLIAGFFINMSFGVLYSWSIFASNLTEQLNWSKTSASLPYTTAIFMFALMMIPAGKLQDKYGGKTIATIGGILTGAGFILSSFFTSIAGMCLSFGILSGSGIGVGYASVTPAVVKWFSNEKKGIITGFVVSGFGLSTLYMAPLTNWMIQSFGLQTSFRTLGIAFIIIVTLLAQLLFTKEVLTDKTSSESVSSSDDLHWTKMIRTKEFIMLWIMFASGALGGLMIIGHLSRITTIQLGQNIGFVLVALTALSNASGRPISGMISDKFGRIQTMVGLAAAQGIIFLLFSRFTTFPLLIFGAFVITFTYGGNFAVYPSAISDYFGKKNFGLNYGILFSAWGIGGVTGPIIAGKFIDMTGTYEMAYLVAATLSFVSVFIGITLFLIRAKEKTQSIIT